MQRWQAQGDSLLHVHSLLSDDASKWRSEWRHSRCVTMTTYLHCICCCCRGRRRVDAVRREVVRDGGLWSHWHVLALQFPSRLSDHACCCCCWWWWSLVCVWSAVSDVARSLSRLLRQWPAALRSFIYRQRRHPCVRPLHITHSAERSSLQRQQADTSRSVTDSMTDCTTTTTDCTVTGCTACCAHDAPWLVNNSPLTTRYDKTWHADLTSNDRGI